MKAADSSPPSPVLADDTLLAVRRALSDFLAAKEEPETLRASLRSLAAEAREKGMFPERLLVLLKELWFGLPEVNQQDGAEQMQRLQRVVTICIREYYAEPG